MSLPRPSTRRLELLMWVGVLGAGVSWAVTFLFGYGLSVGTCNAYVGNHGVAFDLWTLVATAIGATLATLGIVAAVLTFRASREGKAELTRRELAGKGSAPPDGRIHFLSIIGMVISPLFLCIILVSGLGSFVLTTCAQA